MIQQVWMEAPVMIIDVDYHDFLTRLMFSCNNRHLDSLSGWPLLSNLILNEGILPEFANFMF